MSLNKVLGFGGAGGAIAGLAGSGYLLKKRPNIITAASKKDEGIGGGLSGAGSGAMLATMLSAIGSTDKKRALSKLLKYTAGGAAIGGGVGYLQGKKK